MPLTIAQMALMSRLLDEALPLGEADRRAWLEKQLPEHPDLAQHLRDVLLPQDSQAASSRSPLTLPGLAFEEEASAAPLRGLHPGVRVGPYELIRLLGAGGMAEVWLAKRVDGAFRREVALKLPMRSRLRRDLEPRFARERDILASLEHPHIARLYDAGTDPDGVSYLAMEYIHGQPLTKWCDEQCLAIPARLKLFRQVLEAVQYAHEKRVIHRDLKPSNILVTESDQVRLLDFGVSRLLETDETDQAPLTSVYGRAFTPDYASPELLRGDPIDARSDIYSLGVVLYELLTGVRPYRLQRAASMGIAEQVISTVDVTKPSTQSARVTSAGRGSTPAGWTRQLRGDLDAIALKALAKEPAERYPTAAALAQDLQRHIEGRPIEALPSRFTDRLRKFVRRNKPLAGVTATAVAAVLVTIGYALHREAVTQAKIATNPTAVTTPPLTSASTKANLGAPVGASFSPGHSIVVLPFVDMSEGKDQEYFSDGLSEELIELLGKTPGLRVIPRTSSFYFKGKAETLETIAAQLHVANVLEGSIRKSGNRLRVTAQLVRADTSEHLWSETYDRQLRDVFQVQDEIAGAVVSALQVKLAAAPQTAYQRRTSSLEAYNQYLLGRQFFKRATIDGFHRAAAAYRKAVELDPHYAAAYAELAVAEDFVADGDGNAAGHERALAAANKAVELAPDEAEPYGTRGYMRVRRTWDWKGAKADFEKALALDAENSYIQSQYASLLNALGHMPAAVAAARKATELDPLSAWAWASLSLQLAESEQFSAADGALRRLIELLPEAEFPLSWLGIVQLREGKAREALTTFRSLSEEGLRVSGIIMAEHTLGHAKESQQALDQAIAKYGQAGAYGFAEIYAWRGEKDKAFEYLDRAYQQHNTNMSDFRNDATLVLLHGDPRFAAMLRKMNLPE
jgi:serine/threonine protein kinase/tetratricopeptide (TPR) repeat protein